MSTDLHRIPNQALPGKSAVAVYYLPGGGGFLWGVATARDKTLDFAGQTRDTLAVLDGYLAENRLDRSRIVRAEVIVTDHGNKPVFDAVWSEWAIAGHGPVRSFVQSVMPEGDLIEIIITAALLPERAA